MSDSCVIDLDFRKIVNTGDDNSLGWEKCKIKLQLPGNKAEQIKIEITMFERLIDFTSQWKVLIFREII